MNNIFGMRKTVFMGPTVSILCASVVLLTGCVTTGLSGVQRSLSETAWGYEHVKKPHPVFLGNMSQRFEVRPGDCSSSKWWSDCKTDRERSEVTAKSARFYPGSNKWISFMIYLPKDFKTSSFVNANLGQIHMKGGFSGSAGGFKSFPPLLQLNAKGNFYTACFHMLLGDDQNIRDICVNKEISRIANMKGRWSRVTLHLAAGLRQPAVDIFFNGKKVADFKQSLSKDPKYYYLKYGIYRSFVSRHGGPMPTQIAYYDEVKIGVSREEVEDEKRIVD